LARRLSLAFHNTFKKPKEMNELANKYFAMKQQAIENMQHGNVNAYLAKLIDLNDLRLQLIQMSSGR
jgi:hypothetical protein